MLDTGNTKTTVLKVVCTIVLNLRNGGFQATSFIDQKAAKHYLLRMMQQHKFGTNLEMELSHSASNEECVNGIFADLIKDADAGNGSIYSLEKKTGKLSIIVSTFIEEIYEPSRKPQLRIVSSTDIPANANKEKS